MINLSHRDPVFVQPTNTRMRQRTVSRIGRDDEGLWIRTGYMYGTGADEVRYWREGEIRQHDWDKVFTKAALKQLKPKPTPKAQQGYRFTDDYTIVRSKSGKKYTAGCQGITRRRLVALCRAILEDEGEL